MFSDRRIFTAKHQPIYIKIHRFELHVRCDCVWIVWVISKWTKVGFKKDHIFPIHRFVIIAIFPSNGFQVMEPEWCVRDSNFVAQSAYSYYLFGVCILCIRFFMSLCAFACVLYEFESTFRNEIWFSSIFFVPLLANKNIIEMPMARRMSTIFYWYHIYAIWSHTRIDFEFQNRMTEQIKNYEQKSSTYIEEFLSCIIRDKLIDIEFAGVLIENYWWAIKKWLLALFSRINAYCEKKYAYWRERQMLLLCGESTVVWINRKLKWLFLVTFLWFWIR